MDLHRLALLARSRGRAQDRSAHGTGSENFGQSHRARTGGPFDFAFIDADKSNCANCYDRALVMVRSGGLIAVDNV
jgi:predicted O-methyltransferase YrrM